MIYKLVKVTDLDFNEKNPEYYNQKIGFYYDLDLKKMRAGHSVRMFPLEKFEDKEIFCGTVKTNPFFTSMLQEVIHSDDGIVVRTMNSYYFLVDSTMA